LSETFSRRKDIILWIHSYRVTRKSDTLTSFFVNMLSERGLVKYGKDIGCSEYIGRNIHPQRDIWGDIAFTTTVSWGQCRAYELQNINVGKIEAPICREILPRAKISFFRFSHVREETGILRPISTSIDTSPFMKWWIWDLTFFLFDNFNIVSMWNYEFYPR